MLISPEDMKTFSIRGVIQVGANKGQEIDVFFDQFKVTNFIAFEPLSEIINQIPDRSNLIKVPMALGSEVKDVVFNVASNEGQSSSILTPKIHIQEHPSVFFNEKRIVNMTTLDCWFDNNLSIFTKNYNFLVMDVQGYELEVLKGACKTLKYIDYILCEVNNRELYEGCAMVEQLDKFLSDFVRIKTEWCNNHGWGDALYIRKKYT